MIFRIFIQGVGYEIINFVVIDSNITIIEARIFVTFYVIYSRQENVNINKNE